MNKKNTIIIAAFIAVLCTIGIGYAFLEAKLSVTSGVKIEKHCNDNDTLYGKIMCEASDPDGKVLEHKNIESDSDAISDSSEKKSINYYAGDVSNNNVMFAGFCWKALRTTETDGVKLIYNGHITSDNKCSNSETIVLPTVSQFNESNKSLSSIGYMSNVSYEIKNRIFTAEEMTEENQLLFGKKFTYDAENNIFKIVSIDEPEDPAETGNVNFYDWANYTNELNEYHYTCLSNSDSCETIKFVFKVDKENTTIYYIELNNGKTIENAISEMLTADDVNTNDSPIKSTLETWYKNYLAEFGEYIEETTYCNDRKIIDYAGWSPTGNMLEDLKFNTSTNQSLICEAKTDRFSTNPEFGNGKNTERIGLLTIKEAQLFGKTVLNHSGGYWLMSPESVDKSGVKLYYIDDDGEIKTGFADENLGVRPVISIVAGTKVLPEGNGTLDKPYVINTSGA